MGRVANTYKRRIAALGRESGRLRSETGKVLRKALQTAAKEELYDRTPLDVSMKMFNSITLYFIGSNEVQVGFNLNKAKYARQRLNRKGISPSGGHRLDMNPAPIVRREADPQIRRLGRAAQKRILSP
jgi:hypothetical protein